MVGTLDVNIGPKLDSEELIGQLPSGPEVRNKRAYLSNVCVLGAARRQGIAKALIDTACRVSQERGVQHLYVHVAVDNPPAMDLYQRACGFELEAEEDENFARALNRPRRLLLHQALV